nr:uncharacterized protein LOC116432824 isoform X1 [Nomia melanderi]
MSRSDRLAALLALLCVFGLARAIYHPREATTKPPKRIEPALAWYLSEKDVIESTEDPSRSPKWQTDPDNPIPKKPYTVNAETKTWIPWSKVPDTEIQHKTDISETDCPKPINVNRDGDYALEYSDYEQQENRKFPSVPADSRDLGQRRDRSSVKNKEDKHNVKSNQDYEEIPADNTKPHKEELSVSSSLRSTVARYDSKLGVQCPDFDSTGQFVYPPDCKFFVNCWKGRAFVQPCAPGTLFNPDTLECDFPHKVSCYGGEVAEFPSTEYLDSLGRREPLASGSHAFLEHERLREPRCPPQITGMLPHPSDCTKFLQCANGGTHIMDCGPGTVFNPAISVCDWPRNVRGCEDALKSSDTTTPLVPPDYETFEHKKLQFNRHEPAKKIVCPADFTGLLPHPDTCTKFLQCANGGTFIMDCGPGTAFNPSISVCDWPYNVPGCSEKKTTTAKPWSSGSDSRNWEHTVYNQYGRGQSMSPSNPTTSRPATDWDALRPTWRPSWMPNSEDTAKPPEADSDTPSHNWKPHWTPNTRTTPVPPHWSGQYGHGSQYDGNVPSYPRHPDESDRWGPKGNPGSPSVPWQQGPGSSGHVPNHMYHQHHHHVHHHYPYGSTHNGSGRPETQQPAPPSGPQPQGPRQPDGRWQPEYHHHDHHHSWPHPGPSLPEYHESGQQTQRPFLDQKEDSSNIHESEQHTTVTLFDQTEDSSNIHESDQQTRSVIFEQPNPSNTHVRFDHVNLPSNRRSWQELTPNRQEHGRNDPRFPQPGYNQQPLPGENVYVDNTYKVPENDDRQTRNKTIWTHSVSTPRFAPRISNQQGPRPSSPEGHPQPENKRWNQGRTRNDIFQNWRDRNIYDRVADKEADSKLNQWTPKIDIYQNTNKKFPPEIKDTSFDASRMNYPSNVYIDTNDTRDHFSRKDIQIHQGHSKTKTYGPNDRYNISDRNIYIDSQSTDIPTLPVELQPPYYNTFDRPNATKNTSASPGRRTSKHHRMNSSSDSTGDLSGSDTIHRQIFEVRAGFPPHYPPPSRSLTSPGSTNPSRGDVNLAPVLPSDLLPPYYKPSRTNSNYPAEPATDLQPPFYEPPSVPQNTPNFSHPQEPNPFLVPPSPDSSSNSDPYSNVPTVSIEPPSYQANNGSTNSSVSVKTTKRKQRVPDVHMVLPKKSVQRTPKKALEKVTTTTEPALSSVEVEANDYFANPDYDVDVLDEREVWKPVLVFENKTRTTTESSHIMRINEKKSDVDLFNIEAPPVDGEEPPFPSYYVPPVEPLDHARKVSHPTPISGQVIRLRGGSGPHEGYVEVQGKIPGWGVVCDSRNSWTLKEAHVVCKQLGYTRGAEMAWQGRNNRNGIPSWIAADSVSCQGNETRFQMCKFTHGQHCRVERDAVGVSCVLNRVAHCRSDEIPYEGHCYHLAEPDSGLNHAEALDYCSRKQARLVDITSQAENDFISEWLLQMHPEIGSIMTSGVGFTTLNHTLWLWEDSSQAKFKFSKWWPGWLEDKQVPPHVGSRPLCIVMKRKLPCHERPDTICVADYFFWDTEDCTTSAKGHSYICKRPYDDIGCVYGKGAQYMGNANVTASGKRCLPWADEKVAHSLRILALSRDTKEKLKTHNYCRNLQPLKESRPWCFTEPNGQREHCDIPPCGNIGSQRSSLGGLCMPKHFECSPGECIPSQWVCDGEEDCRNGADESDCSSQMDLYQKYAKHKLEGHDVEKWLNTPLKTCAVRCKDADFTCRSFSHKAAGNICLLSHSNVGMTGSLKPNREFDYYEMKERSLNCDGMFVCDNKKCINQTKVCNGKNDCHDRSDESICTLENLDYAIRLAGSNNSYEGRIEVKVLGVWGQVCDDGFGMIDADVVCKELGFTLGALEIRPGGFYGNLDPPTRFIVDQLQCRGNETSLRECDFDGWGVHNCQPEEAVGVVCKTAVDTCQDGHWKCEKSPTCIPTAFICDEVVDCPDGSDESSQHCDAPFEIRLANGSSPLEGRVEVRHHGVWGTVCDDDFSTAAATVICRSLGYTGKAFAKKDGYFGPGEGPIWLDEVSCRGNETQLYRCEHNHWGQNNCNHDEDAGVICTRGDVNDSELDWDLLPDVMAKDINDILPTNCGQRLEDFNSEEDLIFAKVVHGSIAPKGSYPWQASIRVRGHSRSNHWCGAVVLSPLHVLTAAHCLEGYNKGTYFVRAGDYNTEIDEGTEAEANIENYYIHEDFRKGHRMNNDIALVLLKGRGIALGKDIMPICLPPENIEYPAGLNCTISGFGSIDTGKSAHSKDLRYGWVPLLDQSVCRAEHVYGPGAIRDGMVCAGFLDEGADTCDGDSGGPLVCHHNGGFTLYGITSWGQHCGKVNKPGVYVRVSHYRRWIDQKIKESLSGR